MRDAKALPTTHIFVCANRRDPAEGLGTGCAARGDALYDALKREVASRGLVSRVWVTRTHCIGICPPRGATIAIYPAQRIVSEVEPTDARTLLDQAIAP